MTPTLYCIAGPLKGISRELTDPILTIGRDRSNHIAISDLHLSRRHCEIRKNGDHYQITDLESRNGVFVDSIPVRQRDLNHGDRIEIGSSIFVFSTKEEEGSDQIFQEEVQPTGSTQTTRWDQRPDSIRDAKALSILLEISSCISSIQNLDSLGRTLLGQVREILNAQRAALFLIHPDRGSLTEVASIHPASGRVRLNRNITDRVLKEKISILAKDVPDGESTIPVMLAAPLIHRNQILGVLYADTRETDWKERDLELLNGIANISVPMIKNCLDWEQSLDRNKQLQTELQMDRMILGESAAMKKVLELIRKTSSADTTVLICGETGTGKELTARAIHTNSKRADKPFVAINCAALPETLMESELFGHEKGAFTGAIAAKKGKFELADGGTLFLDEIGELSSPLQAKLLRFLQEREFERVGGTRTLKVDIRLVTATNKNLGKEVAKGAFRQDLYYRLNVVQLEMPALRDLPDDILLLSNYFVSTFSHKIGRRVHGISTSAQHCLLQYDWPGNVRELENVLERAVLLGSSDVILPEDLPDSILAFKQPDHAAQADFHQAVNEFKKKLVRKALEAADHNYNIAAANLGIHPTHLYRLARNLRLDGTPKK